MGCGCQLSLGQDVCTISSYIAEERWNCVVGSRPQTTYPLSRATMCSHQNPEPSVAAATLSLLQYAARTGNIPPAGSKDLDQAAPSALTGCDFSSLSVLNSWSGKHL